MKRTREMKKNITIERVKKRGLAVRILVLSCGIANIKSELLTPDKVSVSVHFVWLH